MTTSPLLSSVRHRAMIAPVSSLSTGSFILIFIRLKLFSKWEVSMALDFKSNVLYKSIASKKYSVRYELCFKKYIIV